MRLAVSPLVDSPQRRALEVVQPEVLVALQAAALPEPRVRPIAIGTGANGQDAAAAGRTLDAAPEGHARRGPEKE